MSTFEQAPTFNLKVVVQETGLKPDTLRAWERRYGLPAPDRTQGGHRLYSQRDIDMLKWLMERQEEGLSISRAIALWRKLEGEGQDPLKALAYAKPSPAPAPALVAQGDTISELRQAWLAACKDFDEARAEQILAQTFARYSPETVCFELFQKGLAEIGQAWYKGEVTVQQEHFTSELIMRRLETLVAAAPPPTRPGRILIGCPAEEEHTFAPLLLTYLLKRRGWSVFYLGARVPTAQLQETVDRIEPHLVILSAQRLSSAAELLEAARLLQRQGVPLAFGGRIFNRIPALHQRIPGHFLGKSLQVSEVVETLLTAPVPPPLPPTQTASETYRQALAHYREQRTMIEAQLWHSVGVLEIPHNLLAYANQELGHNIRAALTLGDVDFLCDDLSWIKGLLQNHRMPQEMLCRYLEAYLHAAQTHLDARGDLITAWMEQLVNGKAEQDPEVSSCTLCASLSPAAAD
jgi:MerR family transcriptional regulator, light-induced transcriptional regulator